MAAKPVAHVAPKQQNLQSSAFRLLTPVLDGRTRRKSMSAQPGSVQDKRPIPLVDAYARGFLNSNLPQNGSSTFQDLLPSPDMRRLAFKASIASPGLNEDQFCSDNMVLGMGHRITNFSTVNYAFDIIFIHFISFISQDSVLKHLLVAIF